MSSVLRNDWTLEEVKALFALPFMELLFQAQTLHRQYFDPHQIQVSTLLSIKTGGCAEDCRYCSQSARYKTQTEQSPLLDIATVLQFAQTAKDNGASRFCMGAAWRNPKERQMPQLCEMIQQVKKLGLETCMTLGMLTEQQAEQLKEAGLDYYNHNLDTSRHYYPQIITTRCYDDRLQTLSYVRQAGINVCSGGILGLGESAKDRCEWLMELANLPQHPQSVPINQLVAIPGTPLAEQSRLDPFQFIRCIAVARIMMPASYVRLSAGRERMNEQMQALCFMAGANSFFYGDKLLTTDNVAQQDDRQLLAKLDLQFMPQAVMTEEQTAFNG